jgi:hypothetical protein
LSFTVELSAAKDKNAAGLATFANPREETSNVNGANAQEEEDCASTSNHRELLESAFPFRNDLLFGSDHKDKNWFECSEELIAFVCKHLCLHGFGFVLGKEGLDVYQL